LEEQRIGGLYVERQKDKIKILDIAVLPEYRNKEAGAKLITEILQAGEQTKSRCKFTSKAAISRQIFFAARFSSCCRRRNQSFAAMESGGNESQSSGNYRVTGKHTDSEFY